MRREPKVSIVVPVYRTEDYLALCIQSLLNQTHKDFEIVVVDDHSPGDVPAILQSFPSERPAIDYVRHVRNRGALSARLTGIDRSSGDYIGFIDSDDYAHPSYVERLLAGAAETGAGIIGSAKNATNRRPPFQLEGVDAVLEGYATGTIANWSVWTKLYARNLVQGLTELRALGTATNFIKANDLIFNVFCALEGPRYVNIEETLIAHNRDRPESVSNASSRVLRRESFKSIIAVYEAIKGAGNGYESFIDAIIARSAKNNYRNILAYGHSDDFAWVQNYLKDRPIGPLVMVPMLQAAVEDRCKLSASVSALTEKTDCLREKLAAQRAKLAAGREKLVTERAKLAAKREKLAAERAKLAAAREKLAHAKERLTIAQRNRRWRPSSWRYRRASMKPSLWTRMLERIR